MKKKHILLLLSAVLILSLLSGCRADAGTFDPYMVPIFPIASVDDHAEEIKSRLDLSGNATFRIDDMGTITYSRSESSEFSPIQMNDEEAIRQAKEYLNDLGLLPKDEYRAVVSRVSRSAMNLTGEEASQPKTISIDVSFYRIFNGVDVVSDREDGILLSFDAQGIQSLQYLWRKMEASKIPKNTKPISAEDARQIYLDQWEVRHGTCCEPSEDPEIFNAYLQLNGVTRPCWVIAEEKPYTNAWFIDMLTGEILY